MLPNPSKATSDDLADSAGQELANAALLAVACDLLATGLGASGLKSVVAAADLLAVRISTPPQATALQA